MGKRRQEEVGREPPEAWAHRRLEQQAMAIVAQPANVVLQEIRSAQWPFQVPPGKAPLQVVGAPVSGPGAAPRG